MTERHDGQSSARPRLARQALRLLFFILGLALFLHLLHEAGLQQLVANARRLGLTFPVIVLLYGGVHFLRAVSWRFCLREEKSQLPLASALRLWLCGESLAHVSFAWSGETFRAAAMKKAIALPRGLSALVVSRLFYTYASLLVVAIALMAALWFLPVSSRSTAPLAVATAVLFAITVLPLVAGKEAAHLLRLVKQRLSSRRSSLVRGLGRFVEALEKDIEVLLAQDRKSFLRLTGLNLLAALAGVLEVYLVLRALAFPVDLPLALSLEAMSKAVSMFSFLAPGNVGVREGVMVLVFRLLRMHMSLALTLVLVRRARALAWVAFGGLMFLFDGIAGGSEKI